MPRVPTAQAAGLGSRGVEPVASPLQSAALPAIRVPRDAQAATPAAAGRALSGLGGALGEAAGAARERALLREAETASAAAIEALLGESEGGGEGGYLATAGREALLDREPALRALDALGRSALAGLEPALRPRFARLWAAQHRRAVAAVDGHAGRQFGRWLDAVDLEAIAGARRTAAASGGEPEAVGEAQARAGAALGDLAARGGWPPERRREAVRRLRSQLHDAVVRRLLEREDFGRAAAYLRGAGAELTAGDRRALEPLIEAARGRAAALAREAAAGRLIAGWRAEGLTVEQQRAAARRLARPALAALVVERLEGPPGR